MPRQVITLALFLAVGGALAAQGVLPAAPVWTLTGPSGQVVPGQPFTVQAEVRLPARYYQDAESPFLVFEAQEPARTLSRTASEPAFRTTKPSYQRTFQLIRTLVIPEGTPEGSLQLWFTEGWQICQLDGVCLLPGQARQALTVVVAGKESGPSTTFFATLGAAFLGGLILNLMPCVFPVLALKALGLAGSAGQTRSRRRRDALAAGIGGWGAVMLLGLATAGVATIGQRLDWGFPFQQPGFVWSLALVFWLLTLQTWGLWKGAGSTFILHTTGKGGLLSSMAGGAFLILAAAPCTAPVLGPVLGFALSRPPLEILAYFSAVGAGLALPLFVLQAIPDWGRILPKPGPWMVLVERIAGGLLAATVAYLVWVTLVQTGLDRWPGALAILALVALLGHLAGRKGKLGGPWVLLAGAALLALGSVLLITTPIPSAPTLPPGWKAFSRDALEQSRASGQPVFVDATAAWCATCQVNEVGILRSEEVERLLDDARVIRLRADYTLPDPSIQLWLVSVQRAGLPVYALYVPGKSIYLFPELLNRDNFTLKLPSLLGEP